jgi:hypothetical protein
MVVPPRDFILGLVLQYLTHVLALGAMPGALSPTSIKDFSNLREPRGCPLLDRTATICNTASIRVATFEALT